MNGSIKKKVNGIGLAGKIVSIVLIVCMGLGCFGLLVGAIFFAAMPKDALTVYAKGDFDLVFGKSVFGDKYEELTDKVIEDLNKRLRDELDLNDNPIDIETTRGDDGLITTFRTPGFRLFELSQLSSVCLSGLIKCAALLVIFVFLLRLSDAFRVCESPFEDGVIKRMMTFAWVLLGGAVLMGVSFTGRVTGMGIFSKLGGLSYSARLTPILIALVVLFLSAIFRYGAQLQKESDETL